MSTDTPAPPAPWHLDIWFDGPQFEQIRVLSERWNCSLEETVRRLVEWAGAPPDAQP